MEYGFKMHDKVWLDARYTKIEYNVDIVSQAIDDSHPGVYISPAFAH